MVVILEQVHKNGIVHRDIKVCILSNLARKSYDDQRKIIKTNRFWRNFNV